LRAGNQTYMVIIYRNLFLSCLYSSACSHYNLAPHFSNIRRILLFFACRSYSILSFFNLILYELQDNLIYLCFT